jgi:hypothetical protein
MTGTTGTGTCNVCRARDAVYRAGDGDTRCAECAPGRCQLCWVFGRGACRMHRGANAAACIARGYDVALKVLAGEHLAFVMPPPAPANDRCLTCDGGGALPNGTRCQFCGGTGEYRPTVGERPPITTDAEEPTTPTLVELPVVGGESEGQVA